MRPTIARSKTSPIRKPAHEIDATPAKRDHAAADPGHQPDLTRFSVEG
jgi:hypothetical protein